MSRAMTRRWLSTLAVAALIGTVLLPLSSGPEPAAAQTSDSLCTGDPNVDFYGPCGPSLTEPGWSDATGWDDTTYSQTIALLDIDGDGRSELLGRGPNGVLVYRFSNEWGQWAPAYDFNKTLPFPAGDIVDGTLRFGQLADGLWGAIALKSDGSGLETWSWSSGNGSLGSGFWTLENQSGPFDNNDPNTLWYFGPAYYSTIQFIPEPLGGSTYGIIARGSDGIHFCSWDTGSSAWSCKLASSAFNDTLVTNQSSNEQWPYNLADFYYDTIQFGDIYSGAEGPELFGRDYQGGGVLKVYTWDNSSQAFTELKPSGNWPFWTSTGSTGWNSIFYSSSIQPVQLSGVSQPQQVIGRSQSGLQWFTISDTGCGGQAPPCWKNLTHSFGSLSDYNGFGEWQYSATLRFADLDGDGIDEAVIRQQGGALTSWGYHQNAGWYALGTFQLQLTSGPDDDPLWSDPSYYGSLQVGDITGSGQIFLVVRGKYGVRTFGYWDKVGWGRPYVFGFQPFDQADQNAYALVNAYLNLDPNSGTAVRDQYSANVASTLATYVSCLNVTLGQPAPPSAVCPTLQEGVPLANPNGVTGAQWNSMAQLLIGELQAAQPVTEYIANSKGLINDLYFQNETSFSSFLNNKSLFPNPPDPSHSLFYTFFNLFIGLGEAGAILTGPDAIAVNAGLHIVAATVGAMQSMQTPSNPGNTRQGAISEVDSYLETLTSEALSSQQGIYEYVTRDMGLLALYGAMTQEGFWTLDGDQYNAAVSAGEYSVATWIYQTMLPVYWQVWACHQGGDNDSCRHFDSIAVGTNADQLENEDANWIGLIGDEHHNAIDPSDELFGLVFNPVNCTIGGTDTSTNWRNTGSCNAGADYLDVIYYDDGWTTLACVVAVWNPPSQQYPEGWWSDYACGDGPPDNFGP